MRRGALLTLAAAVLATTALPRSAAAADSPRSAVKVGVSLALTGPDAWWGLPMRRGIELAIDEVNRAGGAAGHPLEALVLDSAGPGFEGVSSRRGLQNFERLVADPAVIVAIGPQTSGEARAVGALLSRADLATLTPSATTPDVTDPARKARYRPLDLAVYFRTVGTDPVQGEAMARFAYARLGVRRPVLIDDGRDFGMRVAAAFAKEAAALGMSVVDWKHIGPAGDDYRRHLRAFGALQPDALYFAGEYQMALKLARQSAEVLPAVHRLGAETLHDGAFALQAGGVAAEGWYVSSVAPDVGAGPTVAAWADRFRRRFGEAPTAYSLTAHTAVTVIAEAVGRVARSGRPVTRTTVREAIQATRLRDTPQGPVSFDANGDLERPAVSIYQVRDGTFHHRATVIRPGPAPSLSVARTRP